MLTVDVPGDGDRGGAAAAVARVGAVVGAIALLLGMASAYRAWVQVYALDVRSPDDVLRPGGTVRVDAVTSGRTPVDVRLEIAQGERSAGLGSWRIRDNGDAALDPRPRRASVEVRLAGEALAPFAPGAAELRATATGRPQWLRLPPPTVRRREVAVEPPLP